MGTLFKTLTLLATSTALLTGCSGGSGKSDDIGAVIKDVGKWNMTSEQKAKYSHLSTNDARTLFVRDTYMNKVGVAETEAERNRLAAAVYLNFSMLQNQAIPNYCAGMNVDISAFQTAYARNHARIESGVKKILADEGTSLEAVQAQFVPKYKTAAKYELMSTGSSYSACTTIKDNTSQLANKVRFSQFYPGIAQTLRGIY